MPLQHESPRTLTTARDSCTLTYLAVVSTGRHACNASAEVLAKPLTADCQGCYILEHKDDARPGIRTGVVPGVHGGASPRPRSVRLPSSSRISTSPSTTIPKSSDCVRCITVNSVHGQQSILSLWAEKSMWTRD